MNLKCIHCHAVVDPDERSAFWDVNPTWCDSEESARHDWGAIDEDTHGPDPELIDA